MQSRIEKIKETVACCVLLLRMRSDVFNSRLFHFCWEKFHLLWLQALFFWGVSVKLGLLDIMCDIHSICGSCHGLCSDLQLPFLSNTTAVHVNKLLLVVYHTELDTEWDWSGNRDETMRFVTCWAPISILWKQISDLFLRCLCQGSSWQHRTSRRAQTSECESDLSFLACWFFGKCSAGKGAQIMWAVT